MNYKTIISNLVAILFSLVFNCSLFAQNATENPPIIKATLKADITEINQVIADGANINEQDEIGYTALIWACSYSSRENYREAAKQLISNGADVNIQSNDGNAAIIEAAGDSPEIFNLLVEKGADINVKKNDGSGAFFDCLATLINYGYEYTEGYKQVIEFLLSKGANVDDAPVSGDLQGFTPLIFAARDNKLEIAKLLIDHEANVNAKNIYDQTPLSVAEGKPEMIKLLKAHGAK